jgi:hypothetical protein
VIATSTQPKYALINDVSLCVIGCAVAIGKAIKDIQK